MKVGRIQEAEMRKREEGKSGKEDQKHGVQKVGVKKTGWKESYEKKWKRVSRKKRTIIKKKNYNI